MNPSCLVFALTFVLSHTHDQTPNPQISRRKQPQQARSTELVAAVPEAAVQVLTNEGAQRFTTAQILEDRKKPPFERLRTLVHAFVRSECEEAEVRVALNDAAPLYRDAPEAELAAYLGARKRDPGALVFEDCTCPISAHRNGTPLNQAMSGATFGSSCCTCGDTRSHSWAGC
jgi:hypothetical protein